MDTLFLTDIAVMDHVKNALPMIRYACYIALGAFAGYVIYKRISNKVITYLEVQKWAESICVPGDICHISRLSVVPDEVQRQIHKELGIQQIINGYRYDGSVFVTITDSQNNIKNTSYFMGKELDKELSDALSAEIEHRITF